MVKKTLGGDRLGSGNRMKQELHNYYRSNHNLSCSRISSMAPGVLYPMYTNIGLTGDTFDMDLSAFVRTLPTEGPLFGAFKLQVDVFSADFRLYQAILHNNTTEIGMDMNQVLLPKINLSTFAIWDELNNKWQNQIAKSALLYYLGISGVGTANGHSSGQVQRNFNAIPMLAYYDIYKNYYANKQEENAYIIASQAEQIIIYPQIAEINKVTEGIGLNSSDNTWYLNLENITENDEIILHGTNLTPSLINVTMSINSENSPGQEINMTLKDIIKDKMLDVTVSDNFIRIINNSTFTFNQFNFNGPQTKTGLAKKPRLQPFELSNIDRMRKRLLTSWDLGEEYIIDADEEYYPYKAVVEKYVDENQYSRMLNENTMQGLAIKCYQSDMFNNWLDSEWVSKITERSKVNVTNGSFTMDALNLAKKIYNHYNRVAITGGTYDDWQLAAYGEENYGKSEKPIYHGGMSAEVIFDEVISQAASADQPLGTLGGRGTLKGNRGGHIIIKCREACVIMVMVSLTPRLTYSQGNAWYNTELNSIDDLHKPEFDRIGFQDLILEKMAWWDTIIHQGQIGRRSAGKQPAWIDYQTDVDKCFGDFAEEEGRGYMVLKREYTADPTTKGVKDITTYIDPSKYNYAFAVNDITAQNFWTFLNLEIKARRKMSAKQIPNF